MLESLELLPYSLLRLCAAEQDSEQLVSGRSWGQRPQAVTLYLTTLFGKESRPSQHCTVGLVLN